MWYLRRMERISYTAHKTNELILSKTQKTRMIIKIIESRQLKFFGHVIRKKNWKKPFCLATSTAKEIKDDTEKLMLMEYQKKYEKVEPSASEQRRNEKSGNFYGKPMSETRHGTVKK